MGDHESSPGIRVIPPVLYLIGLALGYGLQGIWPVPNPPQPWAMGIAVVAIFLSALIVVPVIFRFRRASTPFDVRKSATSLVTDGPYRYSRNPGYVALTLLYVGIALLFGSVWMLLMLIPILWVMRFEVVAKEERHLRARFGDEYLRYQSRVRRWI